MDIDACIATYRRPRQLQRLLADLRLQVLPAATHLRVIVVDNDRLASAREVVDAARADGLDVTYEVQPEQNISLTRNAALALATAPLIAIADDDESAPVDWLATLLSAMGRFDADIVMGPVAGVLPADTPGWVRKGGFFAGAVAPTGKLLRYGGAGNVLMKRHWVEKGKAFDPTLGLRGGEDTELFFRLSRQGARIVWCQEARLEEHIGPDRTTLRWLLRRALRAGQTYADVVERPANGLRLFAWAVRRFFLLCAGLIGAALVWPLGRHHAVRLLMGAARSAGQLSTLGRYRTLEYAVSTRP